jgi:acyl-CoA thioesterase
MTEKSPTPPTALVVDEAKAFHARDKASQALGIELVEVRPGFARLAMQVDDGKLNPYGVGHGGMTYMLADAASGYASNAGGTAMVAHSATITYIAPAPPGGRLTATAEETHRTGRTAIYDVTVTDETGTTIAVFRGTAMRVRRG